MLKPDNPMTWSATVTEPIEDVISKPDNSSTIIAVTLPKEDVISKPVGSTVYSTPQPDIPHSCLPQPWKLEASTSPIEDEICKPVVAAIVSTSTVGKVALTFMPKPVNSSTITAVAVPKEDVISWPVGFSEYSTPQPELFQACLPQPSTLKASGVSKAEIVPGDVTGTETTSDCQELSPQEFEPQVDAIRKTSLC